MYPSRESFMCNTRVDAGLNLQGKRHGVKYSIMKDMMKVADSRCRNKVSPCRILSSSNAMSLWGKVWSLGFSDDANLCLEWC